MKAAPLPVSKTVARLVAQVQAEAEAATLEALSAKDGIVVLQPMDSNPLIRVWGEIIVASDDKGCEMRLAPMRTCPECWVGTELGDRWHPSHWTISTTLVDGQGRQWEASRMRAVMDDFGTLVPVQ